MSLGVRNFFTIAADLVITSSAALVTSGLSMAVAASQVVSGTFYLPFTVGATGGIRAQLVVPSGGSAFSASFMLQGTTGAVTNTTQLASAAFTNALASAADYTMLVYFQVKNGATAGTIDLQIAQNTSDALSLTLQSTAWAEVVYL